VEGYLSRIEGVAAVTASPSSGRALIIYDQRKLTHAQVLLEIETAASLARGEAVPVPGLWRRGAIWRTDNRRIDVSLSESKIAFAGTPGEIAKEGSNPAWKSTHKANEGKSTPDTASNNEGEQASASYEKTFWPAANGATASAQELTKGNGKRETPQTPPDPSAGWRLSVAELIEKLTVDPNVGLDNKEARRRLIIWGSNRFPRPSGRSRLTTLRDQVANLPMGLLAGAAGLSVTMGELREALAITSAACLNAIIGYGTERRTERLLTSWDNLTPDIARVLRSGREYLIDARNLVPGDIISMTTGDRIPADARLLYSDNLTVDESILTGESGGVPKAPDFSAPSQPRLTRDIPVAERRWIVFQGTNVVQGSGVGLVVATGANTQFGMVRVLAGEVKTPRSPIERNLDQIGTRLGALSIAACSGVLGIGLLRGRSLSAVARSAIALACSAIPEGLPATATTTLALSTRRLRQKGAYIRRLSSAEAVGAVTTLCVDKTGTLTENRMHFAALGLFSGLLRPSRQTTVSGQETYVLKDAAGSIVNTATGPAKDALTVMALNSEDDLRRAPIGREALLGSATEKALWDAASTLLHDVEQLRNDLPRIAVRHRRPGINYVVTVHTPLDGGLCLATVKGAPEQVIDLCSRVRTANRDMEIDATIRHLLLAEAENMAADGQRVLALAHRRLPRSWTDNDLSRDYKWLGLVGLSDPVRKDATQAVEAAQRAGVRVIVLTGDHKATAEAVCREVGLIQPDLSRETIDQRVLEAASITEGKAPELARLLEGVVAVCRVAPEEKLRIVQALQSAGEVVAMTGDGVNDAPALKAADVGIAMAGGTDVARSIGDVVLADDRLAAVLEGIREGRVFHDNIRHSLRFLLTTNLSEVVVMLVGTAIANDSPLSPVQLLWINLLTDVAPGLALGMEPPDRFVMNRPPRDPAAPLLSTRDVRRMGLDAAVLATGSLVPFFAFGGYGPKARSVAFDALVIGQLLHALACRGTPSAPNPYLWGAVGGMLALQAAAIGLRPLRSMLGLTTGGLGFTELAATGAGAILPLFVIKALGATRSDDSNHGDSNHGDSNHEYE